MLEEVESIEIHITYLPTYLPTYGPGMLEDSTSI